MDSIDGNAADPTRTIFRNENMPDPSRPIPIGLLSPVKKGVSASRRGHSGKNRSLRRGAISRICDIEIGGHCIGGLRQDDALGTNQIQYQRSCGVPSGVINYYRAGGEVGYEKRQPPAANSDETISANWAAATAINARPSRVKENQSGSLMMWKHRCFFYLLSVYALGFRSLGLCLFILSVFSSNRDNDSF